MDGIARSRELISEAAQEAEETIAELKKEYLESQDPQHKLQILEEIRHIKSELHHARESQMGMEELSREITAMINETEDPVEDPIEERINTAVTSLKSTPRPVFRLCNII